MITVWFLQYHIPVKGYFSLASACADPQLDHTSRHIRNDYTEEERPGLRSTTPATKTRLFQSPRTFNTCFWQRLKKRVAEVWSPEVPIGKIKSKKTPNSVSSIADESIDLIYVFGDLGEGGGSKNVDELAHFLESEELVKREIHYWGLSETIVSDTEIQWVLVENNGNARIHHCSGRGLDL